MRYDPRAKARPYLPTDVLPDWPPENTWGPADPAISASVSITLDDLRRNNALQLIDLIDAKIEDMRATLLYGLREKGYAVVGDVI